MKYKFWLILTVLIAAALCSCTGSDSDSPERVENFDKDASYAFGMGFAADITDGGIFPDVNEFIKGFKDYFSGNTRFDEDEAEEKLQTAFETIRQKREADYLAMMEKLEAEAKQEGIDFLAENSKKPNVKMTASGLQYEVIKEGNGPKPAASDVVQVHYRGMFINGSVFDNSIDYGEPVSFQLDRVIRGWIEGIQLMSVGSKYVLYIPQELAYGSEGWGMIPPYTTLIFEVELLDIIK